MQAIGRQPQRSPDGAPVHYERHRLEQTTITGYAVASALVAATSTLARQIARRRSPVAQAMGMAQIR